MPETQTTIFKRIGMMMRLTYDEVAEAPLPARWVDLINHLNERERDTLPVPPAPPNTRH